MKRLVAVTLLVATATNLASCVESADGVNGSGATFPQQFQAWATTTYSRETGQVVLYANPAGGSSKGKADFKANLNDFGGTDSAVKDSQAADFPWVYVPYVGGAVGILYRLDALDGATLSLGANTLRGILSGRISHWNDPDIVADMLRAQPWVNDIADQQVEGVTTFIAQTDTESVQVTLLLNPGALRRLVGTQVTVNVDSRTFRGAVDGGQVTLSIPAASSALVEVVVQDTIVARYERRTIPMPDVPITVIYRADGSGTSNNLCKFLAAGSQDWTVNDAFVSCVPGGSEHVASLGSRFQGQTGSANLANYVSNTDGAIGYSEVSFAVEATRWNRGTRVASIENAAGRFVPPTPDAVSAFLAESSVDDTGFVALIYDQPDNHGAYPIAAVTYALGKVEKSREGDIVRDYFRWILDDFAPRYAQALGYAPLAGELKTRALVQVEQVSSR